MRRIEER
jgi:hypothetical protein